MQLLQLLLYAYTLALLVDVGNGSYCRYQDLIAYNVSQYLPPIDVEQYRSNCIPSTINAAIVNSKLVVHDCVSPQYNLNNSPIWQAYTGPVPLKKGQFAHVKCGDGAPTLLINPPSIDHPGRGVNTNDKPSVFVVMIDAVSYEAFHRLMPKTLQMLEFEKEFDIHKFTKYTTVGLNSNPNKFSLFGRHNYANIIDSGRTDWNLSWIWEHASDNGYITVIAEDECPRWDSVWGMMNVPTSSDHVSDSHPDTPHFVLLDQLCVSDPNPNKYCVKGKWGFEYVVDYVSDMLEDFERKQIDKPVFMWSNFIDAHEPSQWAAALMDATVADYLRTIMNSRFMENGVILFLSDHGVHFGDFAYSSVLGAAENRHPFLYSIASKGLVNEKAMSVNKDRLVTPSDIYQTMASLIGHEEAHDGRDIDIFSSYVPHDRTCEMAGIPMKYCICSYGPDDCLHDMPPQMWHTCITNFAHPRFFDWQYYGTKELHPRFGREFTECEAITHWCNFGLSFGWNGTDQSTLRQYVASTPELASTEFCWNWPHDCNWAHVLDYYFYYGYTTDPIYLSKLYS